jgi:predicted ester cyclase
MSVQKNKDIVAHATNEGINKGNVDFADEVFAPDYEVHAIGLPATRGPEAFKLAVGFWRSAFPDFHMTIHELMGEGDMVTVRFTTTGTHRGPLMGIPPTGKTFTVSGADVHRVVGGRVVESWISDDMPRILLELGALVPGSGPNGGQGHGHGS